MNYNLAYNYTYIYASKKIQMYLLAQCINYNCVSGYILVEQSSNTCSLFRCLTFPSAFLA